MPNPTNHPNENVQLPDLAIEKMSDHAIEHLPENLQDNFAPPPVVQHASVILQLDASGPSLSAGFDLATGTASYLPYLGTYSDEVDFSITKTRVIQLWGQDSSVGTAYANVDLDAFVYDPAALTNDFDYALAWSTDGYGVKNYDATFVFTESDGDTYVVGNFEWSNSTLTLQFDYYLVS